MSDQLESQSDKISDLEKILDDKKDVLRKTEDILQREMLTRCQFHQHFKSSFFKQKCFGKFFLANCLAL